MLPPNTLQNISGLAVGSVAKLHGFIVSILK
jgi:hypothetical protein